MFIDCPFRRNFTCLICCLCTFVFVYVLVSLRDLQKDSSPLEYESNSADPVFIAWLKIPPDKVSSFSIDTERVLYVLDNRFLSFSIDSAQIYKGLQKPSLRNERLRRTVAHLRGGYLRVGGNAADLLVFSPGFRAWSHRRMAMDGGECSFEGVNCPNEVALKNLRKFSMSASDWNDINDFASVTGLKLLFDLNVLLRSNNSWNYSNAELLLDFAFSYHYDIDWQLGNEPNSFKHRFGVDIPPKSLAGDFNTLRRLLNRYAIYNSSRLVGPDVTNPRIAQSTQPDVFLERFLDAGPAVGAVTWHHYYTGPNATVEDYLSVDTLNSFANDCKLMIGVVRSKYPKKPVWIGETGSSYGGGIENMSDRFVSSFLWIDKLGVAALNGIALVVRQAIYGGHYGLLDERSLLPNPDFWISVLFRKHVGTHVLRISCVGGYCSRTLRLYAHCSPDRNAQPVIFGLNLADASHGLDLTSINATGEYFSLTSRDLLSRNVALNTRVLSLYPNEILPPLNGAPVNLMDILPVPPHSIFFIRINSNLSTCSLSSRG